jgi:major membrane immunogen (membrane-anchored lipoprotein)
MNVKKLMPALLLLLLTACNSSLTSSMPNGTYYSKLADHSFAFHPDGTFDESNHGKVIFHDTYKMADGKMVLNGGYILMPLPDGNIDGGIGYGIMVKK